MSTTREPVRLLVFSASLRTGSWNTKLAELAAETVERQGGTVDRATLRDFVCPSYDGDEEEATGIPAAAQEFRRRIQANDALIIASPEYNASMPGVLKNSIDWISRFQPHPLNGKHLLLLSASPSLGGGNRGLWALRIPFEHLSTRVYPDMFSLAQAPRAFDAQGKIADQQLSERFDKTISGFLDLVEADTHYKQLKAELQEA